MSFPQVGDPGFPTQQYFPISKQVGLGVEHINVLFTLFTGTTPYFSLFPYKVLNWTLI